MVGKKVIPEQKNLDFLGEGNAVKKPKRVDKPKKIDHSDQFGLEPEDFSCPQCEIGGGACAKHPKK